VNIICTSFGFFLWFSYLSLFNLMKLACHGVECQNLKYLCVLPSGGVNVHIFCRNICTVSASLALVTRALRTSAMSWATSDDTVLGAGLGRRGATKGCGRPNPGAISVELLIAHLRRYCTATYMGRTELLRGVSLV